MSIIFIRLVLILFASLAYAKAGETAPLPETKAREPYGPGKGVLDATLAKGFKLHDAAYRNFKIERVPLIGKSPWVVPSSAVVQNRGQKQVFVMRDGYLKAFELKIAARHDQGMSIASDQLKSGDSLVITGAGFLVIVNEFIFGEHTPHEH